MLKARDLREESLEELSKRAADMQDQLFKLRFQRATGQLDDSHKIRNVRKELARVLTVIYEKQSSAAAPQEGKNA
jgi:large subunit ribosomal protein L29